MNFLIRHNREPSAQNFQPTRRKTLALLMSCVALAGCSDARADYAPQSTDVCATFISNVLQPAHMADLWTDDGRAMDALEADIRTLAQRSDDLVRIGICADQDGEIHAVTAEQLAVIEQLFGQPKEGFNLQGADVPAITNPESFERQYATATQPSGF